jgi:hypothetical protein
MAAKAPCSAGGDGKPRECIILAAVLHLMLCSARCPLAKIQIHSCWPRLRVLRLASSVPGFYFMGTPDLTTLMILISSL